MKTSAVERLESWIRKSRYQISVFCITFLIGTMIHLYMLTNKFYNYFEMNNILTPMSMDKGDTLAMGRWLLPLVSRISSVISMPMVNGVICISCLSLVTCMTVDILKIRRILTAALTGAVIVSFPGVASYLSYGVNSDVFCVALLLSVASAWVLYRTGRSAWGMTGAALILCCCIGVYQPFMSVTIALIYVMLFMEVWKEGKGFRTILYQVIRYLIVLVAGFALYYIVLKIVTAVLGISVGDYHGVNEIASFTVRGIIKGIVYTYLYFLRYLFTPEYANYTLVILFDAVAAALFFYYCIRGCRMHAKNGREKGSLLCQILLVMFLPIGVNATPCLMADRVGNGVDRYMMFSMMLLFILLLRMMEETEPYEQGKREILQWGTLLSITALIWGNAYMCNQGYFRAEAMTNSENTMLVKLSYRLETDPEWTPDTPVFFANCEALFNENTDTQIDRFDTLTRVDGTEIKPWYNYDAVVKYMEVYLNFPVTKISEETQKQILSGDEFEEMGIYPAQDSVRLIDGVLVVKFNENSVQAEE